MAKKAIVTGLTGQMGSYIAEFLLSLDYSVIGAVRRLSVPNRQNIAHINNKNLIVEVMDLGDNHSIQSIICKHKPDYFFNCAANSFVGSSWACPEQHIEFNTLGVLRQLEAITKFSPSTRYINFGSSEEFGDVKFTPQTNLHPPSARSPYGASKVAARQIVKVYRESYGLYALQCWCFNYESERRGEEFVTRKITKNVARIKKLLDQGTVVFPPLELGNVDARRDWSHAQDFVQGIWRMLNQEQYRSDLIGYHPDNILGLSKEIREYILSSNETHSVREFVELAFAAAGISGTWQNLGSSPESEEFVLNQPGSYIPLVRINPKFYRPAEVDLLLGNSTPARTELGWEPRVSFRELVGRMVKWDLDNP